MKTIITITLLLFAVSAYAQETFYVNLGGSYNTVDQKETGHVAIRTIYASFSANHRFHPYFGSQASLYYLNQESKTEVNSFGGSFQINYFPIKEGFKLTAGFQIGLMTHVTDRSVFAPYGGFGYEVKRFDFFARYVHNLRDNPFKNTTLVGVGYKFASK